MPPFNCGGNLIFNVIDLCVGILLTVFGFINFRGFSFESIVVPVYIIVFGLIICVMAFYIPTKLGIMIPFYLSYFGRGLTFLFLGCLSLGSIYNGNALQFSVFVGVFLCIIAVLYLLMFFLTYFKCIPCSLPPPFLQLSDQPPSSNNTNKKDDQINTAS
mmetsp:Transcript_94062/g.115162  ORF Transcript_94062/g.115162 Transcript_94062/m.115162 type:complete len:159 (-) Transcript_94062:53-529(-)